MRASRTDETRSMSRDEIGPDPEENDAAEPEPTRNRLKEAYAAQVTVKGETVGNVLDEWLRRGPVVHEATGIPALDEVTGGGPVYGTRWALLGAPDAGKTALLTEICHALASRGVFVGLLAVDEEPADLVTRLAQRVGYMRRECEEREPATVERMREELQGLRIRFYGYAHTIESAAADLHAWAVRETPAGQQVRTFLGIDSIQTVSSEATRHMEASGREVSPRAIVSANCIAVKLTAIRLQMMMIFTSEMARAAYRTKDAAEEVNDMAMGKESGAIEYVARVQLALRSVKGSADLLELSVVKNKHGRSGDSIFLSIDRARQTIKQTDTPEASKRADRAEAGRAQIMGDAAKCACVIASWYAANPGEVLGTNRLRREMRARFGSFGNERTDTALVALGAASVKVAALRGVPGPVYLDGARLSQEIVDLLPPDMRADVLTCRPIRMTIDMPQTTSQDPPDPPPIGSPDATVPGVP